MSQLTEVKPVYDMLLEDEERVILNARKLREDMITAFIDRNGGVPDTARDIRLVNEVLNSMDAQTLGLVDRRLKTQENENQADANELIAEMLLRTNERKQEAKPIEVSTVLPEHLLPDNLVPGEDTIEYEELTLEDIRK